MCYLRAFVFTSSLARSTRTAISATLVLVAPWFASSHDLDDKANEPKKTKCKFVICILQPKTETFDGAIDKALFDKHFMSDYFFMGNPITPPKERVVDGLLIVSDEQNLVTLPIVHWITEGGKTIYLCQGTTGPPKAPSFHMIANTQESIILKIKKELTKTPE